MSTAIDNVLGRLEGVRQNGRHRWSAFCPHHESPPDGHKPSLAVKVGDDGTVLVRCFAGCTADEITAAMGLTVKDLFADHTGRGGNGRARAGKVTSSTGAPKPASKLGKIVATYDYRNAAGELLFQAVRLEPKDFRLRRPDSTGGWTWKMGDTPRVLYRLPELLAADPDKWSFVVEGEKDADSLAGIGLPTTTNPTGAGRWNKLSDDSALHGRKVCIIADKDRPGREHAQDVATRLGKAAVIKIIEMPDVDGQTVKDTTDYLDARDSAEPADLAAALVAMAEAAPAWAPECVATTTSGDEGEAPAGDVESFPLTDSGHAELLAHLHGHRLRYDHRRRRWLVWADHYWREDTDGEPHRLALAVARHLQETALSIEDKARRRAVFEAGVKLESRSKIEAMLSLAQSTPPLADAGASWDEDPLLLACASGVVELNTGTLRSGRQEDRITLATPVGYDPSATCPRWERFLQEVLPDDDTREFVRLSLGYAITGLTREQCFWQLDGQGANGKSTLLQIVGHVLGPLAGNVPFSTFLAQRGTAPTNDIAGLVGRRFVTASETTSGAVFDEARVKALTGEDVLTARFLYAEFFTFAPCLKLFLASNHRPIVRDDSYAFWRRARLVHFPRQFTGDELDPDLPNKLKAEAPGILAWLVRAAGDYLRDGLTVPSAVAAAVQSYRQDSDVLADFLAESCFLDDAFATPFADLHLAYGSWAEANGIKDRERMTRTAFGRRLGERFTKARPDGGAVVYHGIGVREAIP